MTSWVGSDGRPSGHLVRAAIHVIQIVDDEGSLIADLHQSYLHRATGGLFVSADLIWAEEMLVDSGLLVRRGDKVGPSPSVLDAAGGEVDALISLICLKAIDRLGSLQSLDIKNVVESFGAEMDTLVVDAQRREDLLLAFARRFDDAANVICGEIGEELVIAALRDDLNEMGYPHLAQAVRRVSLESDQLGYDVTAPKVMGTSRLIEVKATSLSIADSVVIYLTRNEADTGSRFHDWSLVVCSVSDTVRREGEIIGWCSGQELAEYLPEDVENGMWREAKITLDLDVLRPGLPPAV